VSLDVRGGGAATPDGMVGTALYKKDDAGLVFNIYEKHVPSDYAPRGPPVFTG
jgi:lytic cellulose monooxygenase (C1-hydroxylating)